MLALWISTAPPPNPTPGTEQFAEEVRSETAGAEARSHPDDLRGPYGILSRMGRALVFVAGKDSSGWQWKGCGWAKPMPHLAES